MKTTITFLIFLSAYMSYGQVKGPIAEAFKIESNCEITSITQFISSTSEKSIKNFDSEINKIKMYVSSIEIYNEDKNVESDVSFNKNQEILRQNFYLYDTLNQLILIEKENVKANNKYYIKKQYLKNTVYFKTIFENEVKNISVQEYDNKDQIIEWIFLDENQDTSLIYEYNYDLQGNKIGFRKIDNQPDDSYSELFKYDDINKLIGYQLFNNKGKLKYEYTIKNIKNHKIENEGLKVEYQRKFHTEYTILGGIKQETDQITFYDECGNMVKRYTNESCGNLGDWIIIYLEINYK